MLIRSQDKKKLIPMMPLSITTSIRVCNGERNQIDGYIIYSMDNVNTILGTYSTEEKAIKVLDMIADAYCKMKQNECTLSVSFETLAVQNSEMFEAFLKECRKVFIFQMPQEEDVKV